MPASLHVLLLRVFQRLPVWWRRRVVRTISPSYTVGSMCFIERSNGDVLLVKQTYRTRWGTPGGLAKRHESAADAAHREVLEEVGITIDLVGEPAVVVEPTPQRVDIVFKARPATEQDADRAVPSSPEITEVGWFARDALPELQAETATALVALARATPFGSAGASN